VQFHPRLQTARLRLRSFLSDDADGLSRFAGDREVAGSMISLPHPISPGIARSTIAGIAADFQANRAVHFALERLDMPGLIGAVELREIEREHAQAELSFWIAPPFWGQGFATEAARESLRYGFGEFGLNRIYAYHMLRHPASGAVLRAIGLVHEGVLRQRVRKWNQFEDVALYAALRSDSPAAATDSA
jgi:ribosomal-protein-alanine N-acetyltransferase